VLNEKYSPVDSASGKHTITIWPSSTIVIAASMSNNGNASLATTKQNSKNLISSMVADEPQMQMATSALNSLTIKHNAMVQPIDKSLYDYFTTSLLYQPCAALSNSANSITTGLDTGNRTPTRCATLKAQGYLTNTSLATQADKALAKLHDTG